MRNKQYILLKTFINPLQKAEFHRLRRKSRHSFLLANYRMNYPVSFITPHKNHPNFPHHRRPLTSQSKADTRGSARVFKAVGGAVVMPTNKLLHSGGRVGKPPWYPDLPPTPVVKTPTEAAAKYQFASFFVLWKIKGEVISAVPRRGVTRR